MIQISDTILILRFSCFVHFGDKLFKLMEPYLTYADDVDEEDEKESDRMDKFIDSTNLSVEPLEYWHSMSQSFHG